MEEYWEQLASVRCQVKRGKQRPGAVVLQDQVVVLETPRRMRLLAYSRAGCLRVSQMGSQAADLRAP